MREMEAKGEQETEREEKGRCIKRRLEDWGKVESLRQCVLSVGMCVPQWAVSAEGDAVWEGPAS